MNEMVKMSIDSRRNAFFNAYNINDDNLVKEINDLFKRIEELGSTCKDQMEFENVFATNSLNTEYINLFTKIAQTCNPIIYETTPTNVKSDEELLKEELESEARYQMKEATLPARRVAREAVTKAARNTPIVGDLIQAKQTMDLFGKFTNKHDDN